MQFIFRVKPNNDFRWIIWIFLFHLVSSHLLFLPTSSSSPFSIQTQTVYGGCKRKPSLYGSRHLTYEAPFPIDECYIDDIEIRRRPSRRERRPTFVRSLNRTLLRSHSLNVRAIKKTERIPVVRNASTPSTFQYANQSKYGSAQQCVAMSSSNRIKEVILLLSPCLFADRTIDWHWWMAMDRCVTGISVNLSIACHSNDENIHANESRSSAIIRCECQQQFGASIDFHYFDCVYSLK